jgi:hypothetical protein
VEERRSGGVRAFAKREPLNTTLYAKHLCTLNLFLKNGIGIDRMNRYRNVIERSISPWISQKL